MGTDRRGLDLLALLCREPLLELHEAAGELGMARAARLPPCFGTTAGRCRAGTGYANPLESGETKARNRAGELLAED
jgi:hypothetical protein